MKFTIKQHKLKKKDEKNEKDYSILDEKQLKLFEIKLLQQLTYTKLKSFFNKIITDINVLNDLKISFQSIINEFLSNIQENKENEYTIFSIWVFFPNLESDLQSIEKKDPIFCYDIFYLSNKLSNLEIKYFLDFFPEYNIFTRKIYDIPKLPFKILNI